MKKVVYNVTTLLILTLTVACSNLFAFNGSVTTSVKPSHLVFVENKGQITDQYNNVRKDIDFTLRTKGLNIFIGSGAIHYQFNRNKDTSGNNPFTNSPYNISDQPTPIPYDMYRMDVELIGANKHAQLVIEQKQDYYENHYTDNLPNGVTAHTFTKVTYKNIYPNIDWVLYIKDETLKHEFIVRQGGRVSDIRLNYGGATELKLNRKGELIASTPMGDIIEQAPYSYDKNKNTITSQFVLNNNIVSYKTGNYSGDLIIDPSIVWATYFGGNDRDYGWRAALDASGNLYTCGGTQSTTGLATVGAHQATYGGNWDAYLAKHDNAGNLLWATYYGGSDYDISFEPAVDGAGNVYLVGYGQSTTTIATPGSFQATNAGLMDAFLIKFNSAGTRIWGTYFGGTASDLGKGIEIDASGDIYIVGQTQSASGLATSGAHQTSNMGGFDGFIAKFTSSGSRIWSTYYGGGNDDEFYGVECDASGNLYLGGFTLSTSGIASVGAYRTTYSGGRDAHFAKFNSAGVRQWGTYFGGTGEEYFGDITMDPTGNIYFGGTTGSASTIATAGAHQTVYGGGIYDGYLAKFSPAGSIHWCTYYGGSDTDAIAGIANDLLGNIYFYGYSASTTGIATIGALQPTNAGAYDVFYGSISGSGSVISASYFGGPGRDGSYTIINDHSGNLYLTGTTRSTSGISTSGAYQPAYGGGSDDGFMVKINYCTMPTAGTITGATTICAGSSITLSGTPSGGTWSSSTSGIATVGSASGIVAGVAGGTVTISYAIANTCGVAYATRVVTVNPLPIVGSIAGATSVCTGSSVLLSCTTIGGTWSSSNPSIATVGATTGLVSGIATGIVTISYGVTNSCGTTYSTYAVTVNTVPVVAAISGLSTTCIGSIATLFNSTPGGTWSSGSTGIATVSATTGDVTGVALGTATISYTVTNTCGSTSVTYSVTVSPLPVVSPTTGPSTVCIGGTITLVNATTGGIWSTANSTASVSGGVVTGISAGSNTVSYSVSNTCGTTVASFPITVIACPSLRSIVNAHSSVNILPNPTTGTVSLTGTNNATIKVYNTIGQLVASANNTDQISIAEVPAGLYFVRVFNEQGELLKQEKVIKQ